MASSAEVLMASVQGHYNKYVNEKTVSSLLTHLMASSAGADASSMKFITVKCFWYCFTLIKIGIDD